MSILAQSFNRTIVKQRAGRANGMDLSVHKLQVLSHQSKIASIIEIFVARAHEIQSSDFKSCQMSRLGYLSLDSNVKTNFKARELKTVFVNSVCRYIRLTVQDFHRNQLNLFNQVGFVALNIVGSPVSDRDLAIQDHSAVLNTSAISTAVSAHTVAPAPAGHSSSQFKAGECVLCADENGRVWLATEPAPGCYAVPVPPLPSAALADAEARRQLQDALTAKLSAALAEDYVEAARLRGVCDSLLGSAELLRVLAEQKAICIAREDYDGAQRCKLEIEAIRASWATGGAPAALAPRIAPHRPSPHPPAAPLPAGPTHPPARTRAQPPQASQLHHPRPLLGVDQHLAAASASAPHTAPHTSAFSGARSSRRSSDSAAVAGYPDSDLAAAPCAHTDARDSRGTMDAMGVRVRAGPEAEAAAAQSGWPAYGADEDVHAGVDAYAYASVGADVWRPDGRAADERPLKGAASRAPAGAAGVVEASLPVLPAHRPPSCASPQDDRPLQGAAAGAYGVDAVGAGVAEEPGVGGVGVGAWVSDGEAGVGGNAIAASPEPLSLAAAKDAEPLLPVLGEYVVRCAFSKQWALRQAACRAILHAALGAPQESSQAVVSTDSPAALLAAASKVVRRALDDSAVVSLAAMDTLLACMGALTAGVDVSLYTPAQAWPRSPAPAPLPVPPAQAAALVEPLLPPLLALLGAANARLRTVASEALLALVSGEGVPRALLVHTLCRPLGKRDAGKPLAIRHRCQLVAAAHTLLQRDAQTAALITLGSVSGLATAGLAHRDGAVREAAAHMLAVVAGAGGMRAVRATFKSLAAAPLELVAKEVDKLSSSAQPPPAAHTTTTTTSPPRAAAPASPEPAAAAPARAVRGTKPTQATQSARRQGHGAAGRPIESPAAASDGGNGGNGASDVSGGAAPAPAQDQPRGGARQTAHVSAAAAVSASAGPSASSRAPPAVSALMAAPPPLLGTEPLFGALDVDHSDPQCCQFCGHSDPALADEAAQDLHFWQACPMLCQCPLCEQVIEIATLCAHIHGECEADFAQERALAYRSALDEGVHGALELVSTALAQGPTSELYRRMLTAGHTLRAGLGAADICPLCFVAVGPQDRAWRVHLLAHPCARNTRIRSGSVAQTVAEGD